MSRAADAPAKEAAAKETEKLAGVWVPTTAESAGVKADGTDDVLKDIRYAFTKDGKFRRERAGEAQPEGTYTADPTKKPRQIDYKIEKAASDAWVGKASRGIYEPDGDTPRVCRTWPDNDVRPTEFTGAKDTKQIDTEFKRAPKK